MYRKCYACEEGYTVSNDQLSCVANTEVAGTYATDATQYEYCRVLNAAKDGCEICWHGSYFDGTKCIFHSGLLRFGVIA